MAKIADRVAVISKGRIVEEGDVQEVLKNPKSEETAQLLNACIVSGGGTQIKVYWIKACWKVQVQMTESKAC